VACNSHRSRVPRAPRCGKCRWGCRTCNTLCRHHTGAEWCSAGCMSCWGAGTCPSLAPVAASAPDTVPPCRLSQRAALPSASPRLQTQFNSLVIRRRRKGWESDRPNCESVKICMDVGGGGGGRSEGFTQSAVQTRDAHSAVRGPDAACNKSQTKRCVLSSVT
jgi:hypothetical protein